MDTDNQQTVEAPEKQKKGFEAPKAVAVILAVLLALFTVVGLIGFNVWRVLFNPPLVKQTLTDEVVSTDLVPATLEVFSEWRAEQRVENKESLSGVNEPDIVLLMSFMKAEEWKEIKELLVTDEFVVDIVSGSVDGLYAWIDSEDIWPDINWDMALLKQRMAGQEGEDAIMVAYLTLPEATEEDIADFQHRLSQVPEGVEVLYNLCQFPSIWHGNEVSWHDDQVADYIDALDSANDNIPAIFNFSQEFGGASFEDVNNQEASLVMAKSLLRTVRFIAIAGWIFALVLLALILIFKVRSKKSLGKYIGIPLIIGGVIAVVIALVGQMVIIQAVTNSMLSATSDFARLEITNSLQRLASLFFQPLLIQGAVLGGIGLVMIVLMFIKRSAKVPVDKGPEAPVEASV